jgi:hypothetical protein
MACSSACGLRAQAMAKAPAVERLTPAQQWTSIGALASQVAAKASRRWTRASSGRVRPSAGSAMSLTASFRCRSGGSGAGVSIMLAASSRVTMCEGARAAMMAGASASPQMIRVMGRYSVSKAASGCVVANPAASESTL